MDILVLLGNKNDAKGNLSRIAKSRCDLAVQLLQEDEDLLVLPTGTFGLHFNLAERAHGVYLANYLIAKGISPDRILPYTNSSNTLEDALCARRRVIDLHATRTLVVTSDFHMRRVQYIFEQVFQGLKIEFHEARSPLSASELKILENAETKRLKKLQTEWVSTPLYTGQEFPVQIYTNADREQKHYDSISLAIVTGIIIIFAYMYKFLSGIDITLLSLALRVSYCIFPIFFTLILFLMYERSADTARTARRIMRSIELSFGQLGFSSIYPRQGFLNNLQARSLRFAIRSMIVIMIAVMICRCLLVS